jgi:preprotein translocase subunit SecG
MFWTNTTIDILLFFYVIDCVFMGLVIMMQRSKQEGLGAAFGGGFTESVWGAQTSQVLVKATVWAAIFFFILSISLARLYSVRATLMEKGSAVQQELLKPIAPVNPATSTITPAVSPNAPTNSASQSVVPSSTPATPTSVVPAPEKTLQPVPAAPAQPAGK